LILESNAAQTEPTAAEFERDIDVTYAFEIRQGRRLRSMTTDTRRSIFIVGRPESREHLPQHCKKGAALRARVDRI